MWWRKFVGYAKTQYGVEFTDQEAEQVRTAFFAKYSRLEPWHEKMKSFARKHKYVRSYSGRIRHLPMIDSEDESVRREAERQSINSPVQGFSSDLGVMAMGRIEEEVNPEYLEVIGFIHDALYAYVPQQYLEWGVKLLKWYMETNPIEEWFGVRLKVPIVADSEFGLNLGETHELKGLALDGDRIRVGQYDFGQFWDEETETGVLVPRQRIPPNGGFL